MVPVMMVQPSLAWGGDGHRMINRLAAAICRRMLALRNGNALDTMEYPGPEPTGGGTGLRDAQCVAQAPEHFIDLEWLTGPLPKKRYD
jgi:hypothetical protein